MFLVSNHIKVRTTQYSVQTNIGLADPVLNYS